MDLHTKALNKTPPETEEVIWQQAAERVDSLLRAYRVYSLEKRAALLLQVLNKARQTHIPGITHPVELSVSILMSALKYQLCKALNETDFSKARLELWIADAVQEIPELVAKGIIRSSKSPASKIATGPELEVTAMLPRPLELGNFAQLAEQTFRSLDRRPIVRSLLSYITALLAAFSLFWFTR